MNVRQPVCYNPNIGFINTVGIDVGFTAGSVLAWAVLAPTTGVPAGALAGEYVGASGDIGIGLGVGANVLVGGSGRTFALVAPAVPVATALAAPLLPSQAPTMEDVDAGIDHTGHDRDLPSEFRKQSVYYRTVQHQ